MSEVKAVYQVKEPNPTGIPARWLRFLYRVARLDTGYCYTITLIVPPKDGDAPQWAILNKAAIESGG
jgi:hypothetical protein